MTLCFVSTYPSISYFYNKLFKTQHTYPSKHLHIRHDNYKYPLIYISYFSLLGEGNGSSQRGK